MAPSKANPPLSPANGSRSMILPPNIVENPTYHVRTDSLKPLQSPVIYEITFYKSLKYIITVDTGANLSHLIWKIVLLSTCQYKSPHEHCLLNIWPIKYIILTLETRHYWL